MIHSGEDIRSKSTTESGNDGSRRIPFLPTPGRKEVNAALVHLYRSELMRANTWRGRLDSATSWAVLTAATTLSFTFGSPANPHFIIPLGSILVASLLFMEARRYRYQRIWEDRVELMERNLMVPLLTSGSAMPVEAMNRIAQSLEAPSFSIGEVEAVGRRLRRNYLWIFFVLAASWNLKVYLHPQPAISFREFADRASIASVPGSVVLICGVLFNALILVFVFASLPARGSAWSYRRPKDSGRTEIPLEAPSE